MNSKATFAQRGNRCRVRECPRIPLRMCMKLRKQLRVPLEPQSRQLHHQRFPVCGFNRPAVPPATPPAVQPAASTGGQWALHAALFSEPIQSAGTAHSQTARIAACSSARPRILIRPLHNPIKLPPTAKKTGRPQRNSRRPLKPRLTYGIL